MRRPNTSSLLLHTHHPLLAPLPPPTTVEEIAGLIKLHKNGHVERLPAMPEVPASYSPDPAVTSVDVTVNRAAGMWARIHVPKFLAQLPVVLYFHGGGFCVGSPAWRCYHEFLGRLAAAAACVVVSPNYRLAPEHRLPAAYDDGAAALGWLMKQAGRVGPDEGGGSWRDRCDFDRIFIGGMPKKLKKRSAGKRSFWLSKSCHDNFLSCRDKSGSGKIAINSENKA